MNSWDILTLAPLWTPQRQLPHPNAQRPDCSGVLRSHCESPGALCPSRGRPLPAVCSQDPAAVDVVTSAQAAHLLRRRRTFVRTRGHLFSRQTPMRSHR